MKRYGIIGIVLTLLLTFTSLVILQLFYYNRVVSIRKEQTRQQTSDVLREVAEMIELGELVRYLNNEVHYGRLRLTKDRSIKSESKREIYPFPSPGVVDTTGFLLRLNRAVAHRRDSVDLRIDSTNMNYVPNERLLQEYVYYRDNVDDVILRYVYDNYDLDSIPQLINVYYVRDLLRSRLDSRGLCEAFHMAIYDANGNSLYTYTQPGMLRSSADTDIMATQYLFAGKNPNARSPYMQVTLDLAPSEAEIMRFAVPGIIISSIVFVMGIFAITLLIRQNSYEKERTNFVNNMTHELKTPVSSISLATEMLRSKSTDENPDKRRQMISIIEVESKRLKLLVDKVLQFSLLDGKIDRIKLEELDINDVLLPVAEIYEIHTRKSSGSLELSLEADKTWVSANKIHLTNVFFNLLDNAVKYSHPDRPLRLYVSTYNQGEWLIVEIMDNGIGVPKHELKRVFNRFYRVMDGYKHEVKGFGLGLSYVSSVIHQFGGTVTAENAPTGGLKMIIRLPILGEMTL